jgi:hypothetical protein
MSWRGVAVFGPLIAVGLLYVYELVRVLREAASDGWSLGRGKVSADSRDDADPSPMSLWHHLAIAGLYALLLAAGDAIAAWLGVLSVPRAAIAGASAGVVGGLMFTWLLTRLVRLRPVLGVAPFVVANAVTCWLMLT